MELIAKTFQGLEPLLAQELTELGADDVQIGRRMVTFTGDKEMLYRANFCLRTAIRILKPIKHFKARSADDVYEAVKAIDWSDYLSPQTTFAVDSVVFSNEFRHSKFVAYKVKDAIADQFREQTGTRPNVSISNPDIRLHIHIAEYDATLALDSSGESLHRRGYRQESVAAPLNEVLAAGIIMMTGWKGETDLLDPFCGSGTFCIEAALIARGIAPGVFRESYAFEKWPDFDRDLFERIYNDDSAERPFEHHIYGRDNDPKAVGIARRNVKAAGLTKEITIDLADFRETPLSGQADNLQSDYLQAGNADGNQVNSQPIIITNPPYGERISTPDILGLYKTIGQKLKREHSGGEAWILSLHEECFEQIGLRPSLKTPLYNGSLECELRKYVLFDGRLNEHRAAGGELKSEKERRMMKGRKPFKQHRDRDDEGEGYRTHFRGRSERSFGSERMSDSDRKPKRFNRGERDFDGKGRDHGGKGHDFSKKGKGFGNKPKRFDGDDRRARQEARRRFFGGEGNEE
ncbi:MAG: RNA methyltransferase [Bacteroidaceae bacterium]|nr:RNA methyltransferase [Bacteroidaceae bacterium]